MALPKPLLAGRTPLFTVRQAEEIHNALGFVNLGEAGGAAAIVGWPGNKTQAIQPKRCCAFSSIGALHCFPLTAFAPFLNASAPSDCAYFDSGTIAGIGNINPNVWTLAQFRAIADTVYSGLTTGVSQNQIMKNMPKIIAKAKAYFPVGDIESARQVSPGPPYLTNFVGDINAVRAFMAVAAIAAGTPQNFGQYPDFDSMPWGGLSTLASQMLPYVLSLLSEIDTVNAAYPDNKKLLILDGFSWSPPDAVTADIARQMRDPSLITCQAGWQLVDNICKQIQQSNGSLLATTTPPAAQQPALALDNTTLLVIGGLVLLLVLMR